MEKMYVIKDAITNKYAGYEDSWHDDISLAVKSIYKRDMITFIDRHLYKGYYLIVKIYIAG